MLLHETFKKDNSENTELTTWVFEGFVPTAKLVNGKGNVSDVLLKFQQLANQYNIKELRLYFPLPIIEKSILKGYNTLEIV